MNVRVRKNIINDIEKIKKERKLSQEIEKKIFNRAIINGIIGACMLVVVMSFMIIKNSVEKTTAIFIYKISTIVALIITLSIIEIAYKKDSGKLAIISVELLVLSIFVLFSPFIYMRMSYKIVYAFLGIISLYYALKIIKIYYNEKKQYLMKISDITDIVKKESKDELAKKEKERLYNTKNDIMKKENKNKISKKQITSEKKKTSKSSTTKKKVTKNTNKKTTVKKESN